MEIIVKPLSIDLLDDFLYYFDNIGFTDNPEWSVCYCYFHHCPGGIKEFNKLTKEETRKSSIGLIESGKLNGFLAYINKKPAGWCKADLKENFVSLPFTEENLSPEEGKIASVACFLIAPSYRRKGIARKLLSYAISYFKDQNFHIIEAYPKKGQHSDAHSYHGPLSLYESEGFTLYKEVKDFDIVRKILISPV